MDGKQISKWSKDSLKTRKVKSCVPGTFQKGEESLKTSGRSLRSVQRRKDILDSALHVIYREGIQNLTTRKAAEGAGITEGALYRHFSGKGAMLRCLVERLEEGFRIERDDLRGWAGIEAFIRVRTERVLREPELARILFSEFMFTSEPACEEIMFRLMHQNLEVLAVYFEQAQRSVSIENARSFDCRVSPFLQWSQSGISAKTKMSQKERSRITDMVSCAGWNNRTPAGICRQIRTDGKMFRKFRIWEI